jgi:hypothetical protein
MAWQTSSIPSPWFERPSKRFIEFRECVIYLSGPFRCQICVAYRSRIHVKGSLGNPVDYNVVVVNADGTVVVVVVVEWLEM